MIFPLQFCVSYTILVLKLLQMFGQLACRDRQEAVEFLTPAEVPFAKDSTEVWVQDVSFLWDRDWLGLLMYYSCREIWRNPWFFFLHPILKITTGGRAVNPWGIPWVRRAELSWQMLNGHRIDSSKVVPISNKLYNYIYIHIIYIYTYISAM